MIRIATRLGIMACRYLVMGYYENRYISAPEIAERYNMNVRALMPSLRQLTRVGILRSRVGGSTPGFIFSQDPKLFTLLQVLIALEGDVHYDCCKTFIPDLKCDCKGDSGCGVYGLFNEIIDKASSQFSSISMAEHAGVK